MDTVRRHFGKMHLYLFVKMFNYSELHFSEVTSYRIHTLEKKNSHRILDWDFVKSQGEYIVGKLREFFYKLCLNLSFIFVLLETHSILENFNLVIYQTRTLFIPRIFFIGNHQRLLICCIIMNLRESFIKFIICVLMYMYDISA